LKEDPEKRAVFVGLVATIIIHLSLYPALILLDRYNPVGSSTGPSRQANNRTFNIELAPNAFPRRQPVPPAPKPPPTKFVETNPDAPDNEPDKTSNFGAQNQQAAQEKKAKQTGGDHPEMEGRKDIESSQIVSGNLSQQNAITPPTPPMPPEQPSEEQQQQQVRRERNPLPGLEKYTGDNPNAYGSNIAKVAPHPEDLKEKVEGSADAPEAPVTEGLSGRSVSINPKRPQPRQILEKKTRPALFAENRIGTANIGPAAWDARWSSYGQYLQKMIETVQIQWEKLISEGRTYPAPGSIVKVKFVMESDGSISKIEQVESGVAGPQAEGYCVAAISHPSPYGKWSDDMVKVLGPRQELTFSFYYQ
jgi:hypothetical protein